MKTLKKKDYRAQVHSDKANVAYGKRVRAARIAKGFSQRVCAAKLRVKQPYICNIENAWNAASAVMRKRIAKLLGVTA